MLQLIRDICSDADKLEAIGNVGLERCIKFTKSFNNSLDDIEIKKLVIDHCNEKLLKLKDQFIRTDPGKMMAVERHQTIVDYVYN